MAQDPLKPKDDGKIKMPSVTTSMNKLPPSLPKDGGKGSKSDKKQREKDLEEDQKIILRAMKRFERCIQAEADNRKNAVEDLKFLNGDQWPADVAAQRNTDKRPCLTFNKLKTFVHQVSNDLRENRPSIKISPVGDQTDIEAAKMYGGVIRAIERDSRADIAYDTASFGAAANGFGYCRVLTEYESNDTFNQVLRIERVRNPFTVYRDPDHMQSDGSDMRYAFVTEMIPNDEFQAEYPDHQQISWNPSGTGDTYKEWVEKDRVRVAEYYESEHVMEDLVLLSNGFTGFKKDLSEEVNQLIEQGDVEVLKERKAERKVTKWYKLTAFEILERTEQPFEGMIPIAMAVGDEIDVQGKVTYAGLVRDAKDPQRMYNYWKTTEAEVVALQPKAPFIMEEGQVEGHEAQWKQANTKSMPYLLYKSSNVGGKPAPPPQRQPMSQPPAGVLQAIQGAAQDMMAVTGIRFDATPNERMHDESGRAIQELRRSGDIGSFHYQDNLSRMIHYVGKLLLVAVPKVYDTKRVLTILREDGKEQKVQIDPSAGAPMSQGQTMQGMPLPIFNPTIGKYGVTVTTGPSYATRRIEAADQMMAFVKALPQTATLVSDLIAKNMDWPEADQFATRLARSIPPNLLAPDMKGVPPEVQAKLASMDLLIRQMTMERMQLMKQLTDQNADRQLIADKNSKDFDAKILGIVQKMEQAQQKAEVDLGKHIDNKMLEVAHLLREIHEFNQQKDKPDASGSEK